MQEYIYLFGYPAILYICHCVYIYFSLSDVCARFPEEMCPDQFVVFDEIIPCSAKENKESVDYVKWRLRELLDFYDDQEREVQELAAKSRAKSKLIETNLQLV